MPLSSNDNADITPATRKRLLKDLKQLMEEPIPMATAQPCSDQDMTLWDGVIGIEMDVSKVGRVTVPLHFLIDFPPDYPRSAPNIGFSFEFEYRNGASYRMDRGRLTGKKVVCLDVLGNFKDIHTEWQNSVGSGWSPAYTVTTLLVQLQSVLCDLNGQMSQAERDDTYQSALRFSQKNPAAIPEIRSETEVRARRAQSRLLARAGKLCAGNDALAERIERFARAARLTEDEKLLEDFVTLLSDVAASSRPEDGGAAEAESNRRVGASAEVDTNICCFATGKLYTEATLGVGVSREKKNLGTAAELLSKEAYDGGLRQSTNKSPFEYFLPVWINEAHASGSREWQATLEARCTEIGLAVFETPDLDAAVVEVFPRLINQMIVEMMRPDAAKSAAIATFEAMCNFWRTLRFLVDSRPALRDFSRKRLSEFVDGGEEQRHKDRTPDLGVVLVLFTALQGHEGCPSRQRFIDAYVDENSLRWVMWWQRAGAKAESRSVFDATKVSRDICMFQMLVVDTIITADVASTLDEMERTNCKLPERLERLQQLWRQRQADTEDWSVYFGNVGATPPAFGSMDDWIADCVRRVETKGPKYTGSKGKSKGADSKGSKGAGKGGNPGGRWGGGEYGQGGKAKGGGKWNGAGKGKGGGKGNTNYW